MLLQRLGLEFHCVSPDIDESAHENEKPAALVSRLAHEKAQEVSHTNPAAIIIGSDQLAVCNGKIIGKSGNHRTAVTQLVSFSGQIVEFLTAVSVIRAGDSFAEQHIDSTRVHFRQLKTDEIERYLHIEKPYDCAGSFKAESLGIVLFEKIENTDPTALIGLPLIQTSLMLRKAGLDLP